MATINGIVTIGDSELPGKATVLLLNEAGSAIVASTESDEVTGEYEFAGLAGDTAYRVVVMGGGLYRSRAYGPCVTGDPYFANVVSLLHFDGEDGSTVFTDEKGKVWTRGGNVQISTAQSKFGGASVHFPGGSSDSFSTPASPDFAFGTGDFTVEFFLHYISGDTVVSLRNAAGGLYSNVISVRSGKLSWSDGNVWREASTVFPVGAMTHAAICRAGGTLRIFQGGVQVFSGPDSTNISGNRPCFIGSSDSGAAASKLNGYVDEFRVTKGVARYTSSFTPPTRPFPNHS